MLGVHRPTVSVAAAMLQKAGHVGGRGRYSLGRNFCQQAIFNRYFHSLVIGPVVAPVRWNASSLRMLFPHRGRVVGSAQSKPDLFALLDFM